MEAQRDKFCRLFSLTLTHKRHASMADIVKLGKKGFRSIIQSNLVMITLCLTGKYRSLSMQATHGGFSRSIEFKMRCTIDQTLPSNSITTKLQ